jgi:hypothetical protein
MARASLCRDASRIVHLGTSGRALSQPSAQQSGLVAVLGDHVPSLAAAPDLPIASPQLRRLLADWQARRGGRHLPARKDFDVLDLKYMMGNLNLLEVLPDPLRFRYRVHCSLAVDRVGLNLTGKTIDAYPEQDYAARVQAAFVEVTRSRVPKLDAGYELINDKPIRFEALVLPLSEDGESVDMIMVGLKIS